MTCDELRELVAKYNPGYISDEDVARIESDNTVDELQACRVCGCTESREWVEPGLCSECIPISDEVLNVSCLEPITSIGGRPVTMEHQGKPFKPASK